MDQSGHLQAACGVIQSTVMGEDSNGVGES